MYRKLSDKRHHRPKLLILGEQQLETTIMPNESAILINESGDICGVVWRDFVRQPSVLETMVSIGKESAEMRTNIRLDDPGTIQNVGYSPGSCAALAFDWVKNLRSQNLSKEEVDTMNYKISSAFALFWNLCRAWLPADIIADFDKFMTETGITVMGGDRHSCALDGDYEAMVDGQTYKFSDVRLAPPQGAMAVNYARYGSQHVSQLRF